MVLADGRLFSDVSSRHLSCEDYRASSPSVLLCFVETPWQCKIAAIAINIYKLNTMLFNYMERFKNMDSSGPFLLLLHLSGLADQCRFACRASPCQFSGNFVRRRLHPRKCSHCILRCLMNRCCSRPSRRAPSIWASPPAVESLRLKLFQLSTFYHLGF